MKELVTLFLRLATKMENLMETQAQEAIDIQAVADQLTAIGVGIQALEAALANAGGTTPAVDTALSNLKAAAANTSSLLPPGSGATGAPGATGATGP